MRGSLEDVVRVSIMRWILRPAVYLLPRRLALSLASLSTLPLLVLPKPGVEAYWKMRAAFGTGRIASARLAWGWLARHMRDYVIVKRVVAGREDPRARRIVEKNSAGVQSLREAGKPYIVAAAHFTREALFAMSAPAITPAKPVSLTNHPPTDVHTWLDRRAQIQFGTATDAAGAWGRHHELVFIGVDPLPMRTLRKRLRQGDHVVFVHVDWFWDRTPAGSFERPFAAHGTRVFALGAAQLAREADCPIVSCVYSVQADGSLLLEWGSPVRNDGEGTESDIAVMNQLLDSLELGVGDRPTQYLLDIGRGRKWNSRERRWEDRDA